MVSLLAPAPVAAQSPFGRIEIGQAFPDVTFSGLKDGRPASLLDFRGQRVVLLVFASW
jgi:peroxiredoxin